VFCKKSHKRTFQPGDLQKIQIPWSFPSSFAKNHTFSCCSTKHAPIKTIHLRKSPALKGRNTNKMRQTQNITLIVCSFFSLMIVCTTGVNAQTFLAGQHTSSNYYVDFNPDTTMTGPNNHELPWLPAARFDIDINGDGINDFEFYSYGSWSNGAGDSELSIKIHDTSTSQVAFGYMDTCYLPNSTYFLDKMAKSLTKNEPINNNLGWLNTNLFLTYTFWEGTSINCQGNGFINDTLGNYLAVRMVRPHDTLYCWIKLANVNFLKFTVQEFACSKNCTGLDEYIDFVRIYPVPTNSSVTIETQLPGLNLVVYNQYGMEIMKKHIVSGKTLIDLSHQANGIYFFKLLSGDSFIVRKIIKQS
jgi:hypothetical protein